MKNLTLMLLIAVSIFTGCKKDDNLSSDIVGKWYQKKAVASAYRNGVRESDDVNTDYGVNDWIEFKNNSKTVSGNGNETSYTIIGDKLKIIYTDPSDNQEFTIKKLTSNELILYWEYDKIVTNGVVTYYEFTEVTFRK